MSDSNITRPLPITFPLHGTRLIEASAGTGKTYTLAALYLRLVLGHGDENNGFSRPLLPPEILVVTFTDAATSELRERIRERLTEAADVFATADSTSEHKDPVLAALLNDYPSESARQECQQRLTAAAQWMDEAAIYTIHGFCNRMLKQHAFDSGSLFSLELNPNTRDDEENAARDYWRTIFSTFPVLAAQALNENKISNPDALLQACKPLLSQTAAHTNGQNNSPTSAETNTLPTSIERWFGDLEKVFDVEQQARQQLADDLSPLIEWLGAAVREGWLNKNSYKAEKLPEMTGLLKRYASGGKLNNDEYDKLARFSDSGLRLNKKFVDQKPDLRCLLALDNVVDIRTKATLPRGELLAHAAQWIRQRIALMRSQQATMSYDDMITRLYDALHRDSGARLAHVIRRQFPLALIDEFQDTDPLQYGIFSALYENQPDIGWFMIGDPKQAIYSFRGADVHTYLAARRATEGKHYTLGRNFRSATGMVNAVNHLFEFSNSVHGDVFMMDDTIPFHAVEAQGRKEQFVVDGHAPAALTCWVDEGVNGLPISSTPYLASQAHACANDIARLLNLAAQARAGFQEEDTFMPLKPSDIAILVRDRNEAAAIRDALMACNVRSVYLSDRDSVFDQPEAEDLLRLLNACAHPDSDAHVRRALAASVLAQSYADLDALTHDTLRWETLLEQFHGYRQRWQQQGVLPMLRSLLLDFDVPRRLSQSLDGERSLTNLLHLSELLQTAASTLDSEFALIRYLEEKLDDTHSGQDESTLRLESDAERVKVITIHKSKGLEYPLVYLPFICRFKASKKGSPVTIQNDAGEREISVEPSDEQRKQADEERIAEDMRLLYVALTRARYACTLGLAPYCPGNGKKNQLAKSAIGKLLFGKHGTDNNALMESLEQLACRDIAINALPYQNDNFLVERQDTHTTLRAPLTLPEAQARTPWWIASYSALKHEKNTQAANATPLAPASARGAQLSDDDALPDTSLQAQQPTQIDADATPPIDPESIHAFPRGATAGTLLHDVLELAANEGFQNCQDAPQAVYDFAHEKLLTRGWEAHNSTVQHWLTDALTTPLPLGAGKSSALVDLNEYMAELEFLLPARHVCATDIDALITRHVHPGIARPALQANMLNGMLKGFIDLVFQHGGRYYVLDYKSNWLGHDESAYNQDTMRHAVLEKRYDVQYCLYLLALHRLLKQRLPNYDPAEHLGGAVYVFLRGLKGSDAGTLADQPPVALITALDALFAGETDKRAHDNKDTHHAS